ncbi:MAG: hypothetical protein HON32_05280 [Francisellaceae bacterium]|nr:hypothetical protein [Francisellaceae bacterium]
MMSFSEIFSPNKNIRFSITSFNILYAVIRSFSQLFFSEKIYIGITFLLFTAYLSFEATLYAIVGSTIAYVTSKFLYDDSERIRLSGGVGYNCCIIGFYLAEFITIYPILGIITLIWMSMFAPILNRHLHTILYKHGGFPALSLSAVITVAITYVLYYFALEIDIKNSFSSVFLQDYYIQFYVGYIFIYIIANPKISLLVIAATAPILYLSLTTQTNLSYFVINMAIAAYAPSAYFIENHSKGIKASILSILFCVPLFYAGEYMLTVTGIPALLLPAVLSIWLAFFLLIGKSFHLPITTETKSIATILQNAKDNNLNVACLSGAGISTASGIPDYTSSVWIEKDVPAYYYNFEYFLNSRTARQVYFTSCAKFIGFLDKAKPNIAHITLHTLQANGYINKMITQNVDGLLQAAGCKDVIELHGKMNYLQCIQCSEKSPWPDDDLWKEKDLICPECQGLIKPAVKAYGEPLGHHTWSSACSTIADADVLMIVGTRMLVGSVIQLLDLARANNTTVIFMNDSLVATQYYDGDTILYDRLEHSLPTIKILLNI